MGKELAGIIAVLLLLQLAVSILHPSLESVSKCALSTLSLFTTLGIILSLVNGYEMPDFDYDNIHNDEYYATIDEATERGIAMELADKYKLNEEKITVSIFGLDVTKMRAQSIYVRIDDLRIDYRSVRSFLKENFLLDGGSVEVELAKQ